MALVVDVRLPGCLRLGEPLLHSGTESVVAIGKHPSEGAEPRTPAPAILRAPAPVHAEVLREARAERHGQIQNRKAGDPSHETSLRCSALGRIPHRKRATRGGERVSAGIAARASNGPLQA